MSKWVKCIDRLPKASDTLLLANVTIRHGYTTLNRVVVASYNHDAWILTMDNVLDVLGVTHWRPLPKPPKEL